MFKIKNMDYSLTINRKYSYHDKDGVDRNYISYFLNDVLILKQKIPFDTNYELGFDRRTSIYNEYILNGKMYQKRRNDSTEIREVSFPLSKNKLKQFNIPKDFRIEVNTK